MNNQELHRGLEERHITLMSLGACIGVGLFLGSAQTIELAGPAILIAYVIAGAMMFIIMRALGEMAIQNPVAGSFSRYAQEYLGPLAGFLTGWNYWFLWVVTCMAEITAVGVYMDLWFPDVPRWIWALAALVIMTLVNLITVKAYGEFEFWFALIKIVAIIAMIVIGLMIILFGFGNGGIATGISNLWKHGGFAPNGIKGILMSLQMVMFAYLGIEMLGVTAGEAKNPEKTISRAVNSVFWRILIFYVGALFVIMSIYPWNEIGTSGSPFVMTFEKIGIRQAAGIINFVVLTAALSSCNSGIFSTGRMLFNLAEQNQAPTSLKKVSKSGVPSLAIVLSAAALLIGVILNYLVPEKVFTWVTSISTFGAIWTWAMILLSQLKYRKNLSEEEKAKIKFKAPFWPYGSYIALAFLIMVVILMGFFPDTRIALIVGPLWLLLLVAVYYGKGMNKQ
ncbi:amino acid permease [Heyndrickxia oleronia]|jgi:AAT family amino acid transporter|uniref:amino acid permease n=1 Tax=Heyndrickxia oleronia TaxID=38875 RepID=UPI00203FE1F7|nr:amino acid permease [Heyndrickxia oleronia]MCI1590605.1 amino acid permease [Heyndrickxia oleronia]MCI1614265.1 amino acid permease [Heyndrickxia oleronia]MCI1745079.1 amino acid permease [Heyndrickxia oleronia]MCI1762163.1 amino acid permease [Heyndrickxia oleronia]MCM3456185.1 amino acid permease [Heyndrickxia oleronia]